MNGGFYVIINHNPAYQKQYLHFNLQVSKSATISKRVLKLTD